MGRLCLRAHHTMNLFDLVCRRVVICGLLTFLLAPNAFGQEHRIEVITEGPEADGISEEIGAKLAAEGLKVIQGSSRTVCEIWLCKEWETQAGFEQTSERLFPFQPGQLIGALHYRRRGKDFRNQTIKSGWYTLRYALQPTDGNHEGTSPTRDFLLLVRAEDDTSPEPLPQEELLEASATAAGSAHPAMLCLQRTSADVAAKPSMRHVEDRDWWVLQFTGKGRSGEESTDLSVGLVVAGHADE